MGEAHREIHKICGSQSGRDIDKVAASGLKPYVTEEGYIGYEQARLILECKKLYADFIEADNFVDKLLINRWYGEEHGGFHKMYILEIEHVLVNNSLFTGCSQAVDNKAALQVNFLQGRFYDLWIRCVIPAPLPLEFLASFLLSYP